MYSARREPQGLMAGSNDQFKIKTEQSESIHRSSIRLSLSAPVPRPKGSSQAAVRLI